MVYNLITSSKYTKLPIKILYTVLNWGLGHASRSIPIIQYLISQGFEIVIASDGDALYLLEKEFPELFFEKLVAYNPIYSNSPFGFEIVFLMQLKKFNTVIKEEHLQTQQLTEKHRITHIISDNRYGCYSTEIPSTII